MSVLYESSETEWKLIARGKVRDIYEYSASELLIVTTDRLSAFDVILPTPIPDKGVVLTQISNFWFQKLADIIPYDVVDPEPFGADGKHAHLAGRSVIVRKAEALPVEAIVRGYLAGSGRKDYEATGKISASSCPKGWWRRAGRRTRCSPHPPRAPWARTTRTSPSISSTSS